MSSENLKQRAERIRKGALEPETVEYMGNQVTKEEFQELLDEMDHNERTFALTRSRLGEVLDKLVEESQEHLQLLAEEDEENAAAYREIHEEYESLGDLLFS